MADDRRRLPTGASTTGLRVAAVLLLVGVLLQPVFIGGYLGELGAWGLTAHEVGANATFGIALLEVLLVLSVPAMRADRRLVGGLIGILVALTALIGLGYVGGAALVVHVPLAVLVAVGATHHVTTVVRLTS